MMSLEQAIAAAGVDPYALQEMLASGEPDAIYDLAKAFEDAGIEAGAAYKQAAAAHGEVGAAFTNNAAAVLDVDGQNQEAWKLLGQGGQDMTSTATVLRRAGTALETATAGGAAALRRMEDDFRSLQQSWNAFVQRNGVVTPADQQQFAASATQIVQTGAAQVQEHVDAYDAVLASGAGELAQLGYAAEEPYGPEAPGQPGGAKYTLGDPTRPPLNFDDDFVYDPDADAGLGDYWAWNEWGMKLRGASLLRADLDDSLELYAHYRDATGTPMTVDYEEAYREDGSIRNAVDGEINEAVRWAEQLHNQTGSTSFSITGDATQAEPYPDTENWQKALGGHTIWGSGNVRIEGNTATMEVTVHAEDRYNFNRGESDIATGTPDEENGRFAELGWAKSFDVSGSVTRTVTWELGSGQPPVIEGGGDVDRNPAGEDRADERSSGR